jgi:hypothetical protein
LGIEVEVAEDILGFLRYRPFFLEGVSDIDFSTPNMILYRQSSGVSWSDSGSSRDLTVSRLLISLLDSRSPEAFGDVSGELNGEIGVSDVERLLSKTVSLLIKLPAELVDLADAFDCRLGRR